MKVFLFAASLRKASINKKLASLIARKLGERGCEVDHESDFHVFDMPMYDGDLEEEEGLPAGCSRLAARIVAADAMVIVTPEYNHSIPGSLKNAIDWLSRIHPYPTIGKSVMIASAANSVVGGYRGMMALTEPLALLGTWVAPGKFGLARAHLSFTEEGELKDEAIEKLLDGMLDDFVANGEARAG